jgi:hypothetical protein
MHKGKKHSKRGRKTVRGGYYSFDGGVGTGAPNWGRGSEMGDVTVTRMNSGAQYGRGRRRKSRRTKRRRSLRGGGGNKYGAVSASFNGTGQRGMANFEATNTKYPPFGGSTHGAFNNAGAQPGSGFASFNILPK